MKVLMIGAGNMGLTFAEGMKGSSLLDGEKVMVYDIDEKLLKKLEKKGEFKVYKKLPHAVQKADVIFVAVKPYHSQELFEEIKPFLSKEQILVSLMAGVSLDYMRKATGLNKIIRAMPNLPAKVSKGVTAFTETKEVSKIEELAIRTLLNSTGVAIKVSNEEYIDKATGISGSGPAYVFYFMKSMMEAALKMGFSKDDSKVLVSNTFEGAIELFKKSDLEPENWIDKVASKGGTTQAAIDSMDDNNVNKLIKEAAFAAFDRAVELGEENG